MRWIGVLIALAESDPESQPRVAAFRRRLQELGWTDGRNVRIEFRYGAGDASRIRAYAAEMVNLKPDVILANSFEVLAALRRQTSTIPIVFVQVADPVGNGFVASLARPGGNMTGFMTFNDEITGKWLELLKEVAPRVTRTMVMQSPENTGWPGQWRAIEAVAPSFAVEPIAAPVRNVAEVERAIDEFARESAGGLIVLPSAFTAVHRELLVALAARHHMPAVYPYRYFAAIGGLISYGLDTADLYRRSASYVDRILRGTSPGELPVQQPTRFELVINLKTAKALGLTIPDKLLAIADEVIE